MAGPDDIEQESQPFATKAAALTLILLELLVITQGYLAYRNHFLTPSQMVNGGTAAGLPFLAHLGMWGDLIYVSPLAAYIVGRFSPSWRWPEMAGCLAAGIGLSTALGWSYLSGNLPEAHVQNHQLTAAGWLHQAYMALALAIFTQFFIFTSNVPRYLLWGASFALMIHVFVGTHMALGIYNLYFPASWYPAEPLRSPQGWGVFGVVTAILLFRSLGLGRLILTYVFLTMEDPTTSEGYLKLLNRMCDLLIATTYFFRLFFSKLETGISGLQLVLFIMIAVKYFLSRTSVKQELEIGKALYPPGNVPDPLRPASRKKITFLVGIFLLSYWVLGIFYNNILVASFVLTAIACNDFRTRLNIADVLETFRQAEFMPDIKTPGGAKIMERRKVACWYLEEERFRRCRFCTWTVAKEAFSVFGSAVAFMLAIFGWLSARNFDFAAYSILIFTQVVNEVITMWWRIDRFLRLLKIDTPRQLVAAGNG
jgi:hypothetical protein